MHRNVALLLVWSWAALFAEPLQAGRHCGAEGHWLSPFVPERWGSARFTDACKAHDDCYGTCGYPRRACDREFHQALRAECKDAYDHWTKRAHRESCLRVVAGYYSAVYRNGGDAYRSAQQDACP